MAALDPSSGPTAPVVEPGDPGPRPPGRGSDGALNLAGSGRSDDAVFSPDGRLLAAIGTDADIRLWDLGELLGAQPGGER